jgi:tRNA 2-thiouridine synthesizing protein D
MSKFVILIQGPAYGSQHAYSALRFIEAAIELGHEVSQVFFYQDGIYNASSLLCPAADELKVSARWRNLSKQNIKLVCCVSAALRRGIADKQASHEESLLSDNLSDDFTLGGLGEFVLASQQADRVVQFGNG